MKNSNLKEVLISNFAVIPELLISIAKVWNISQGQLQLSGRY